MSSKIRNAIRVVNKSIVSGSVGALVLITSNAALAQQGARVALEEVIVTARKRSENLQTVPISVTTLSAEALENRQITAVEDLGRSVPNLVTTPASGSPTNIRVFMRGLGQGESSQPTAEAAVGLYIDDVYVARSNGANIGMYDIERIEVLRGPQGTLYGRNSTTGAIKVVTKKPTAEKDLSIRASYGELDSVELKVTGSSAISDDWAAGFSAIYADQDGYIDRYNLSTEEKIEDGLNARDYSGARLALSRLVDDVFSADFSLYYFTDDGDASYVTPMDATTNAPLINGDLYTTGTTDKQFAEADQYGASSNLAWQLSEDLTLKSITAYRDVENNSLIDISGQNSWYIDTEIDSYQFSQEFQLLGSAINGRLDWIGGFFYMYEESDSVTTNILAGGRITSTQDYTVETDSYAVFGQGTYHVTDALDITLGLRYTLDEKSFDGSTESSAIFTNGANKVDEDFDAVTPKISVDYQVNNNIMVYASIAEGFKAGGFQGRALNAEDQLATYEAEEVLTYEAGIKSEWLDTRLRVNATYFLNEFEDLQLNSLNVEAGGGTIIQNAAEAEVDGIELEVTYVANDNLLLFVNHATAWDDYKKLSDNVSGVTLDSSLPATPTTNTKLGAEYSIDLANGELLLGFDYQRTSKAEPGASTSELVTVPRLNIYNGFIKYTSARQNWNVGLYGTNLGDKEYHYTGFTFSSFESVYVASPRVIKGVVNYRF